MYLMAGFMGEEDRSIRHIYENLYLYRHYQKDWI